MRNLVTSIIPPKGRLLIRISPPMSLQEKPIALTPWKQGLSIVEIDASTVYVQNVSDRVMPILFFVGDQNFNLGFIGTIARITKLLS